MRELHTIMLNFEITDERLNKQVVQKKLLNKFLDDRLSELLSVYQDPTFLQQNYEERKLGIHDRGNKSKVWRKVASMPIEIDAFFTRIYGDDYYKDKSFFKKFPEWLVVEESKL